MEKKGTLRVRQQSIGTLNPWIVSSTSWSDIQVVRPSTSEICSAEFASWTIYQTPEFDDDEFLGECMELFQRWTFRAEFGPVFNGMPSLEDEEEIMVEPEMHDSLLMAALISTKDLLPAPSAVRSLSCPNLLMESLARLLFDTRHLHFINHRLTLSSPLNWMKALEAAEMDPPNSLATTVSLPPNWDAVSDPLSSSSTFNLFSDRPASSALSIYNIDPTGVSTGSTVSIPANFFDVVVSSASTLFPDPSEMSSMDTVFMDPTGVLTGSTISIPQSFWDMVSRGVSAVPSETYMLPGLYDWPSFIDKPTVSSACTVTVPASFFNSFTSSASTLFVDPSEVSSMDSLFMDPSSLHSFSSSSSIDNFCSKCGFYHIPSQSGDPWCLPSTVPFSPIDTPSLLPSPTVSHDSHNEDCECEDCIDSCDSAVTFKFPPDFPFSMTFHENINDYLKEHPDGDHDEGFWGDCESNADGEPVLTRHTTTASTQTEFRKSDIIRMLEECDEMMEKLVEMKKRMKNL